jgi:hypothetical protein
MQEIQDRSRLSSTAPVLNVIVRSKKGMTFFTGRVHERRTVYLVVNLISESFYLPKRMKIPFMESVILIKSKSPWVKGLFLIYHGALETDKSPKGMGKDNE